MKAKTIVDGLEVSYIDEGEGIPVLLLHGWGCDSSHWQAVIDGLKGEYRVIAPDIPGFGQSEEPPETWTSLDFSRFFEHFIANLDLTMPVVVGHSHGGRIGILLAARGFAQKLILADSAGIKPRRDAAYYAKVGSFKLAKKALSLPGLRRKKEELLAKHRVKVGSADYNAATPAMRRILSAVVNEDLRSYLAKIRVPTLLLWGSEDTATPLSDGKTMEAILKEHGVDTALIVFQGRGHFAYAEECQRFIHICKAFI